MTPRFDPVPRKQLIEEFFVPCYSSLKNPTISNHGLALLYAVFGMGEPQYASRVF